MERALGGRWHVPVRPEPHACRGVLDRHAAADGQRLACTSGTCSRTRTPTSSPAFSGCAARRCSIRWDGTTTVSRPSAACRTTTGYGAIRRCHTIRRFEPPAHAGQAAGFGVAAEFRRALPATDRRRREGVRASVALSRPVGRLVDDLRDDQPPGAARVAGVVPAAVAAGHRVSARGADAMGCRFPHRGRAGGARRSRAARRVSPHPLSARGRLVVGRSMSKSTPRDLS